jgi:SacI homology domain
MAEEVPFHSINVYESRNVIVVSGICMKTGKISILEIKRPSLSHDVSRLQVVANPSTYTDVELENLVLRHNLTKVVSNAFLVFGFVRLLESHYLIVATKAIPVACIHGHNVYTITETMSIPITYKPRNTMEDIRTSFKGLT